MTIQLHFSTFCVHFDTKGCDTTMADQSELDQKKEELAKRLKEKQVRFAEEFIVDLNGTQAAIRAGYAPKSAGVQADRLLKNEYVQAYIDILKQERSERTKITADMVLQRFWEIGSADPSEIVKVRRLCCRYCYGIDHKYQWRDAREYQEAVASAQAIASAKKKKGQQPVMPSDAGGYGYDKLARPNPNCPICSGEGVADIHISDTRDLSPAAKALYAGVKTTQAGIEIKFHSQLDALENVGKHLGMFTEKREITGKNGGPIVVKFGRSEPKTK